MTDWVQYSREVQAASDAAWKQQRAEIDALKKQLREAQSALRAAREDALVEARERISALEMPDAASELANQRALAIIAAIREGHEQR